MSRRVDAPLRRIIDKIADQALQSTQQAVKAGVWSGFQTGGRVRWSGFFDFDEKGEMQIVGGIKTTAIGDLPIGVEVKPEWSKAEVVEGAGSFEAEFYLRVDLNESEGGR